MIDKQLFDRFLKNECSADERRLVQEFLDAHPDETGQLLSEEEFTEVEPESWSDSRSDRSFHQIQQRLHQGTRPLIRWSLVAATILIVTVGVKWLVTGSGKPLLLADTGHKNEAEWITETNDSGHTRLLLLPDGSSAELAPGSRISYRRTFITDEQRTVKLDGEGQFKVTGDPGRPFMVVSEELTTTVLGTWFSVTADKGASTIKVRLYSGKVKVGATDGIHWNSKDSVLFLQPGEELTYDKQKRLAEVRNPLHGNDRVLAKNAAPTPHTTTASHQLTASSKPEWYRFGGQSLSDVFDQLSDYYGVQINYFPADVENHYFTHISRAIKFLRQNLNFFG